MTDGLKLIAGPCSAESESQVMMTAEALKELGVDTFRAGLWKPRTRPGTFEGVGTKGLPWLLRVRDELGMKICTEAASASHVRECLSSGLDMLWIGARTTTSPFEVQEIADALKGSDTAVLVKNPISPDPELWYGAIERLRDAGVKNISAVFRGFSSFSEKLYRNAPHWQAAAEFRRRYPDMTVYCDPSHIAGSASLVGEVSQRALDLGFNALMVEVHCNPSAALSDSAQQLTPEQFDVMIHSLKTRFSDTQNPRYRDTLSQLRQGIDELDEELVSVLARRMELSRQIGAIKRDNNVSVVQTGRWDEVIGRAFALGERQGLDKKFLSRIFNEIHEASIEEQNRILSE